MLLICIAIEQYSSLWLAYLVFKSVSQEVLLTHYWASVTWEYVTLFSWEKHSLCIFRLLCCISFSLSYFIRTLVNRNIGFTIRVRNISNIDGSFSFCLSVLSNSWVQRPFRVYIWCTPDSVHISSVEGFSVNRLFSWIILRWWLLSVYYMICRSDESVLVNKCKNGLNHRMVISFHVQFCSVYGCLYLLQRKVIKLKERGVSILINVIFRRNNFKFDLLNHRCILSNSQFMY